MNRIDLEGRIAIVTGAAQGIGRAIAERFLASGAAVSLWDSDGDQLEHTASELAQTGRLQVIPVEVTQAEAVARAIDSAVNALGGLDILVNNAGIMGPDASVADYPVEAWRRVIEVDLTGVFLGCKYAVPHMIEGGYGRIVNIASIAGKEGNPHASAYSAAKAGVIALTKSLGKELAEHDIAVNCVTPAAARTGVFAQMTEAQIEYMLAKIPRGRFLEVKEVASLVAWLASEENSFTTGGVFDLSGGRATY